MPEENKKVFNASVTYFVLICLFIIVRILTAFRLLSFLGASGEYILTLIIQVGLMLCLPLFLYGKLRKQNVKTTLKEFKVKKPSFNAVIISIILGIVVFILNIGISSFFNILLNLIGYEPLTGSTMTNFPLWLFFVEILFTAVLPGICEEIAHRGMLLNAFSSMGAKKAILLSGLMFGLMHLNIGQFFYASIIGFYLGFLCLFTGNIIPGMIIHFMNNAINVFVSYATVNNLSFGNINAWINSLSNATSPFVVFLILIAIIFISVAILFFLTVELFKETKVSELKKESIKIVKDNIRENYMKDIDKINKKEINNENKKTINFPAKINLLWPGEQKIIRLEWREKIFLYTSIILAAVITIFTLIWGML